MSTALIVGASGLIGYNLVRAYERRGFRVHGTALQQPLHGFTQLDVADAQQVMGLVAALRPEHIVIAAAYTHVDGCERDPAVGRRVNVEGVLHLATAARRLGARVVYLSTDYVFDGAGGPYSEVDSPHPINEYGRQKWEGERIVAGLLPHDHLIVRTTGVYGWELRPRNFVVRLIEQNRAGQVVRAPRDQVATPTYAPNLADAVAELDALRCRGIYNVAGTTLIDRYEFALLAAGVFGLEPQLIEPVDTVSLGQAALRPMQGGLLVAQAQAQLQAVPLLSARQGLQTMKQSPAPV